MPFLKRSTSTVYFANTGRCDSDSLFGILRAYVSLSFLIFPFWNPYLPFPEFPSSLSGIPIFPFFWNTHLSLFWNSYLPYFWNTHLARFFFESQSFPSSLFGIPIFPFWISQVPSGSSTSYLDLVRFFFNIQGCLTQRLFEWQFSREFKGSFKSFLKAFLKAMLKGKRTLIVF